MRSIALALLFIPSLALADEGMWPFNMVPTEKIKKEHGVDISKQWLDHLRLSSARLSSGGSSSFVSSKGLLLTNHHVASDCIAKLDAQGKNFMQNGYLAGKDGPEATCPDIEADVLQSMEDVTAKVTAARKPGMSDADANTAIKGAMSALEKECGEKTKLKCEVVTLYAGGRYDLYAYKRYTDVRLVFAPEVDIAFFGGDPDNFTYPRYDVDMAIFRVYDGGKPLDTTQNHLTWRQTGVKDGEMAFVSGHPGGTNRMNTVAQLEKLRDLTYPYILVALKKQRDAVYKFANEGSEEKRESREEIFGLENSIKALTGELTGLQNPALIKKKKDEETAILAKIKADPKLDAAYGKTWDDVKKVQDAMTPEMFKRYRMLERGAGSTLFQLARTLLRWPDEVSQPNEKRLREFRDSNLDSMKLELFSSAPVYGGVEVAILRSWLERADRDLAKTDPLRATIFEGKSPDVRAKEIVAQSKLFDVYARKKLFESNDALAQSSDPAIALVRALDKDARAVRKTYEDSIEAPMRTLGEKVAQATFAVMGPSTPPDATFTLRLSTGVVKGYTENGKAIPFATNFEGMYAHATGKDPYKLPPRYIEKKSKLSLKTQLNFVSTDDIIGGNSGSPVVDDKGNLIGLIFDGNLSSLPNRFVYREVTERAVSVDTSGMLEALKNVYEANDLVKELTSP